MEKNPQIFCLKYAESVLPENQVFAGGDPKLFYPISFCFYLVKTDKRNILIDTGCDTMPGFCMKKFFSPAFVLRTVDIHPSQITDIILTHAHHDHMAGLFHFPRATVYMERESEPLARNCLVDGQKVCLFDNAYLLDGLLSVQKIGGHEKGSCIVRLRIKGTDYVFAGDECYIEASLREMRPVGNSVCPEKSRRFLETMRQSHCRVLLCHDPKLKTERME